MKAFPFASLVLALAWMQPECAFSQAIAGAVHGGDPAPKDTVRSYNICFPADFELRTCSIPPAPKILLDELGECDVLAVQIEESKYRASGDECFKIFRTYTVMNWCAYSEECGSREDQVFVVNRDAPDFDGVLGEGVCVLVRDADKNGYPEVYYSNDLVADPGELVAIPTPCKKNAHPLWRYTQVIKVYDVERPVVQQVAAGTFSMNSNTCKGNALVRFQLTDNCTGPIKLEKVELAKGKGGVLSAPCPMLPDGPGRSMSPPWVEGYTRLPSMGWEQGNTNWASWPATIAGMYPFKPGSLSPWWITKRLFRFVTMACRQI
ncbi:MAG: hypothetical protein IPN74_15915 [Haliscomenobacter sp.]|nr:hypothetical protein [Haliscomenobacter sp.]